MAYPRIFLKRKRERSVLNRHPWLYSGAIDGMDELQDGDIVAIHSQTGERLGYGHYASMSQIACRMFSFTDSELEFDATYWHRRFDAAYAYRTRWIDRSHTNGFRLMNAEGDELPGLIVDIYNDTAVIQMRTPGARRLESFLVDYLHRQLEFPHVYEKAETHELSQWFTAPKLEVPFTENGLNFIAEPETGQKTGFFLDQRDNRDYIRQIAHQARVLNAFSYSGAFGLYALVGGATEVVSVDLSAPALDLARRIVESNEVDADRHQTVEEDCFEYLRNMPEGHFDLIVLDPPAFTKHISTVQKASRGYKDINLKCMTRIAPGGKLITFSCSQHISTQLFRQIVFGAAADAGRNVRVVTELSHAADHPVSIFHPEGAYLKGLVLEVE